MKLNIDKKLEVNWSKLVNALNNKIVVVDRNVTPSSLYRLRRLGLTVIVR